MAGDGRVNSSKFKALFHTKTSMIQRDQIEAITGFAPGRVCLFNGKVLFLKPEKNLFLSEINNALHPLLLPEFEKAENGYYLPDISFPHTTLATRLNQN